MNTSRRTTSLLLILLLLVPSAAFAQGTPFEILDNSLGDIGVDTELKVTGELRRPRIVAHRRGCGMPLSIAARSTASAGSARNWASSEDLARTAFLGV